MTFVKWPSVENSYRQKFIDKFLTEFPELLREPFVVTEKIHGANMSVYFEPNKPWLVGKRTAFLADGEKFFGIQGILPKYEHIFRRVQEVADSTGQTLRLFGEFFGPGIQKGVDYGREKGILFFGLMADDELVPFADLQALAESLGFTDYLVPILGIVSFQDALVANIEINSALTPPDHEGENVCEGVVMQPLYRAYTNAGGKRFLLKRKNERFLEKSKAEKPPSPGDSEVQRLNEEFKLYITRERLQGIFSKHGEIEEPSQIGDYIRLMLADAKEDFLKDHGVALEKLDGAEQRKVFNVGAVIANMLKEAL